MRRFFVLIMLFPAVASAQFRQGPQAPNPFSAQTMQEMKQIQQAALDSDYAWRELAHLTENIGPRLSGSPQAQAAVDYVADEMRKLGLEVRTEKVMVPHWVRGAETASLVEYPGQAPGTTQKVVLTALGGSVATPADGITADVVVVNDFDELQALGRDKVAGKIVLYNVVWDSRLAAQGSSFAAYGQSVAYRGGGPSAAAKLGAVASLNRSSGGGDYRSPHTGATEYAADAPKIPAAAVTAEDAEMIAHLAQQGHVRMHLLLTPQTLPDAPSYNVVADIKGSEHPEQVVVVSGHLDSWDLGRGAIDDGAGVVVSMQVANLLKQLNLHPKKTIRVIAWMNEENGTMGGRTYAKDHAAELANHFAAIETDGGAGHPTGFAAPPGAIPLLRPLSKVLLSSGAGVIMPGGGGADIGPMTAQGVPSFSPLQDGRFYFNYHHTAADTLDKVDPRELQENAAVVAVLAYALAQLDQPLPRGGQRGE